MHNRDCFLSYLGTWAMHPAKLLSAWRLIANGGVVPSPVENEPDYYSVTPEGVAVISVQGTLMKGWSKFGGTSTVFLRRAIRQAVADPQVTAILASIDSPGGTVAGTVDLADDFREARKVKPTYAYAENTMASAAYWGFASAAKIIANRVALVGSIGVVSVIEDSSEAFKAEGVKVHVVTNTGAETFKGAFADGTPVTEEQLMYLKGLIDQAAAAFIADVARGRKWKTGKAEDMANGKVYSAADAKDAGLVDEIGNAADALGIIADDMKAAKRAARAKGRMAELRIAENTIDIG